MIKETPIIYHRLRVLQIDQGDNDEKAGASSGYKTHLLYNGVSANSWLSPIGICVKTNQMADRTRAPAPIPEACRDAITRRAQLSSTMLGRRVQEVGFQHLDIRAVLCGSAINKEDTTNGYNDGNPGNEYLQDNTRPRTGSLSHRADGMDIPSRPQTSIRTLSREIRQINSSRLEKNSEIPLLTVRQALEQRDSSQEPNKEASSCDICESRSQQPLLTKLLRQSLEANLTSLGPSGLNLSKKKYTDIQDASQKEEKGNTANGNCAICTTPRSARETMSGRSKKKTKPDFTQLNKGHMLKPLLYNRDTELDQQACPSGCGNGCYFQACLASDDYIQESNKAAAVVTDSNRKDRNIRPALNSSRRVKVIQKDYPGISVDVSTRGNKINTTSTQQQQAGDIK